MVGVVCCYRITDGCWERQSRQLSRVGEALRLRPCGLRNGQFRPSKESPVNREALEGLEVEAAPLRVNVGSTVAIELA